MKKTICFAMILILIMTILIGCSRTTTEPQSQEYFCRVMCLKENGIVVWTGDFGNIYVKNATLEPEITPLDTVVMSFAPEDFTAVSESFVDYFGDEDTYTYILERPNSIRYPTAEEPTFG